MTTVAKTWKRSGADWEAGARAAPEELRRALIRLAESAGADLILLLRERRDSSGFVRIAGVATGSFQTDDLAAAATRFPANINAGDAGQARRMLAHRLSHPARARLVLVAARRADSAPFDEVLAATFAKGCDWLEDIVDLWWSRQRGEARAAALRAALCTGDAGIVLLDARGRIIEVNSSAERLLRQARGLVRNGDRLCAVQPDDAARLRAAVLGTIVAAGCGRSVPPERFAVHRDGARPLAVAVLPPFRRPAIHADDGDPTVLVKIVDPDARPVATAATCALYDLTPAETRLTEQLVAGQTVSEAAEALNLTVDTARTYLKHVFAKTGVNRQANLVRVVLNSELTLRRVRARKLTRKLPRAKAGRRAPHQSMTPPIEAESQFAMSFETPPQH